MRRISSLLKKILVIILSLLFVCSVLISVSALTDEISESGYIFIDFDDQEGLASTGGEVSDEDKASIYQAGVQAREQMKNREATIEGSFLLSSTDYNDAVSYLMSVFTEYCDDPKLGDYLYMHLKSYGFSFSISRVGDKKNVAFSVTCEYRTTKEQEQVVDSFAQKFTKDISSLSAHDKVKAIYEYLYKNVDYDYGIAGETVGNIKYTAYSAVQNKMAVCQGFSSLFYRLCLESGISCRVITGYANESHAWNIVRMKDLYYLVDVTWAAEHYQPDMYFLRGSTQFKDHYCDSKFEKEEFKNAFPISAVDYLDDDLNNLVESGTVKDGITYSIYKVNSDLVSPAYSLFIYGEGKMPNYKENSKLPWNSYKDNIVSVNIENGITYVGNYTFANMKNLTSAIFPASVTKLGDYVMFGSENLAQVNLLPGTVMGKYDIGAVYGDTKWEYLPLEDTLIISGNGKMGEPLRDGWYSSDFVPWNNFKSSIKTIIVEEGVTNVSRYAFFNCIRLEHISLPSTLDNIEERAFRSCLSLTQIEIPSGVKTMSDGIFENCDSLVTVIIPQSVTTIGKNTVGYKASGDRISGVVIYGMKGSQAEKYAKANSITFKEYDGGSVPITDEATGVTVLASAVNLSLKVTDIRNSEDIRKAIPKGCTVVHAYDISLKQGTKDYTGNVSVTLPTGTDHDVSRCYLVKISDNGVEFLDGRSTKATITTDTVLDGSYIAVLYKEKYMTGDADGDGHITIIDATTVQQYCAKVIDYRTINLDAAKTSNAPLSIVDATRIQQLLANVITSFE